MAVCDHINACETHPEGERLHTKEPARNLYLSKRVRAVHAGDRAPGARLPPGAFSLAVCAMIARSP